MSEKENISCDPSCISSSDSHIIHSDQKKGENCKDEKVADNPMDLKDCSDVVEEIFKEANIPPPVENEQFHKEDDDDDDKSSVSAYSSASEEFSDPVGHVPSAEGKESLEEVKEDQDEEIELDEEELKEVQKDWSDEEIEAQKEEALSLKNKGNDHFRNASYNEAIQAYTQALNTCPLKCSAERAVLYANRAAAKVNLERKEEAVLDCNKAIDLNPNYLKALVRRAQLHRKLENLDQCLADYRKVLELDPDSREAHQACVTLPQEIAERNEKLKAEMMGKLKDLGNLVLRPFGLSTDNFNVVNNADTGGFNISFQQNKNGK